LANSAPGWRVRTTISVTGEGILESISGVQDEMGNFKTEGWRYVDEVDSSYEFTESSLSMRDLRLCQHRPAPSKTSYFEASRLVFFTNPADWDSTLSLEPF
jgi:hypothetical protein